ncbi:ATP-binding cassette domain-containing protein [Paenibacillus typhae]|uniref:ABC-2 type transport system ATP-binding protein n=1 Tax=Paenibacillus typhae TaxID=1174501 RepID=A0A1G8ZUI7_9BACL|nr:ATP-binding cassette domain-containing protein [Paenibacillus typhae]SDK18294.1 ABC-2 type transport system ATP-binding protein [Paenibacillus typhae]
MILNVQDVSIRYHKANKNAVTKASFSIEDNSIVSIVGHNGAGKSTLIQAIMQNLNYEGTITYGFDKKELYKYIRVQTQTSTFEKNAKVKAAQQYIADHKHKQVMRRKNDHLILK